MRNAGRFAIRHEEEKYLGEDSNPEDGGKKGSGQKSCRHADRDEKACRPRDVRS